MEIVFDKLSFEENVIFINKYLYGFVNSIEIQALGDKENEKSF